MTDPTSSLRLALAERYAIEGPLGHGGMATALGPELDRFMMIRRSFLAVGGLLIPVRRPFMIGRPSCTVVAGSISGVRARFIEADPSVSGRRRSVMVVDRSVIARRGCVRVPCASVTVRRDRFSGEPPAVTPADAAFMTSHGSFSSVDQRLIEGARCFSAARALVAGRDYVVIDGDDVTVDRRCFLDDDRCVSRR